jgi:hypothetical protein
MTKTLSTRDVIELLVRSTGAASPMEAVRLKARAAVQQFCEVFGEPEMPINIEALASLLGISLSNDAPTHSHDAELVPLEDGRVTMRVNSDRPETRKRFSIGHEISHTFFPHYKSKVWCRTDARFRHRSNPDDFLEMLCDIGASELVMPLPWFVQDAEIVRTGEALVELAKKYTASPEATLRRFAETNDRPVLAAFFSWRLKPAEKKRLRHPDQQSLFGSSDEEGPSKKLRLDYSIPSPTATDTGYYLPPHKSVEGANPICDAAAGTPCEGECFLDLGPAAGRYQVIAVPVWTADEDLGPNGENAVGALLEPLEPERPGRKIVPTGPTLF